LSKKGYQKNSFSGLKVWERATKVQIEMIFQQPLANLLADQVT